MKRFLLIITVILSALAVKSQSRIDIKKHKPKIKNPNVVIVPDQKLVIIEKAEDPVVVKRKRSAANSTHNPSSGQPKTIFGSKKAKPATQGQGKKSLGTNKNE